MTVLNLIQMLALALLALLAGGAANAREARRLAVWGSALATVVSLCSLLVNTLATAAGPNWLLPYPALVCLVTLTACSFSALGNTSPSTYGTILGLGSLSTGLTLSEAPYWFAIYWLVSALLTWREVQSADRGAGRIFALSMLAATVLLGSGCFGAKTLGALIVGLAIREACFPFHSWILSFVEKTPMGVVVAFLAPQPGVYLHLRSLGAHLPPTLHREAALLGMVTAIFAAMLATGQKRLKRTLAYLIMSQSGLVAFGLETSSKVGHLGALSAWLLVGLGIAGFAMTVEALEARRAVEIELGEAGGDFEATPILATSFLLSGLSMVGLPGTLGFISEDLLVQGSVAEFPILGLALIGVTAVNAVTVMRCLLTVFVGRKQVVKIDLQPRERWAASLTLAALFLLGLFPQVLVSWFGHMV